MQFNRCLPLLILLKAMPARLKQFPEIGLPVIKASDPERVRDLYVSDYTVRYLITDGTVYILRVWHNKENEKNL